MKGKNVIDYKAITLKIVEEKYKNCDGALMAGSIVRGEGTKTSDIDLIIYDNNIKNGYRESFYYQGIPVEAFVHNKNSFDYFLLEDCKRKMPSLAVMILEAEEIRDHTYFKELKEKAYDLYHKGPGPLSKKELDIMRYFISDLKDDLIGSNDDFESILIVNQLMIKLQAFYLLSKEQWIGQSKWLIRALKKYDGKFAKKFEKTFMTFYNTRDKSLILDLVDEILKGYGGDYFEGFSLGKDL